MSWTNRPEKGGSCPCTGELGQLASLLPTAGSFEFSLLTTLTAPLDDLQKCVERCSQHHSTGAPATGQDPEPSRGLVPLAESILAMCHAACDTYELLDDGDGGGVATTTFSTGMNTNLSSTETGASTGSSRNSPSVAQPGPGDRPGSSSSTGWRCMKVPMALGSLTLQSAEESLLARQIVCTVLTSLSALLRVVYLRDKEAGQDQPHNTGRPDGNEYHGPGRGTLYGREGIGAVSVVSQSSALFVGSIALALIGFIAITVTSKALRVGSRPKGLPPGPQTERIWGNTRQINLVYPQYQYTEWAKKHSRVRDIFIKQGANSQARLPSRFQLLMRDGFFPGLNNGEKWRQSRKMWQAVLNGSAAKQYLPYQELETRQLLFDLLRSPADWRDHIERYSNNLYDLAETGVRGAFLDSWPFLWKLPEWVFPVCKQARKIAAKHRKYIWRNYSDVAKRTSQGEALPSVNHAIQEKFRQGWSGVSQIEGAEIGHHLLTGTTDTTASTLINWVAAMCLNPVAQKKAQEEIDRVVGPNQLPTDADAANLPYVQQVIQESQCWITSVPLSLPRAASGPVHWGKYSIPEETGLIMNSHAVHNDTDIFPEPDKFKPERWEGKPNAGPNADSQLLFTFGAGRRICPGQHLAERSLFLVISHWLWGFDTLQATDEKNKIPIDKNNLRPGFIVCLNPFAAKIMSRSPQHSKVIEDTWKEELEVSLDPNQQWKATPDGIARLIERVGK
ncbi:cytochrome P450 [Aspergillus aurantiobrunneus]